MTGWYKSLWHNMVVLLAADSTTGSHIYNLIYSLPGCCERPWPICSLFCCCNVLLFFSAPTTRQIFSTAERSMTHGLIRLLNGITHAISQPCFLQGEPHLTLFFLLAHKDSNNQLSETMSNLCFGKNNLVALLLLPSTWIQLLCMWWGLCYQLDEPAFYCSSPYKLR